MKKLLLTTMLGLVALTTNPVFAAPARPPKINILVDARGGNKKYQGQDIKSNRALPFRLFLDSDNTYWDNSNMTGAHYDSNGNLLPQVVTPVVVTPAVVTYTKARYDDIYTGSDGKDYVLYYGKYVEVKSKGDGYRIATDNSVAFDSSPNPSKPYLPKGDLFVKTNDDFYAITKGGETFIKAYGSYRRSGSNTVYNLDGTLRSS